MKKSILFLSALLLVVGIVPVAQAQGPKTVRVTTLNPPEGEEKDFYPVWGEIVEISGVVNGDVLAAGGEVYIKGDVNGDVLALGGTVVVEGNVSQDVRVVAGETEISGNVGRNVSVLAGNLSVEEPSVIGGGLAAGVGTAVLSSGIEGDAKLFAGELTINGVVGGDVEVSTERVRIGENADISGDITYLSENEIRIDRQASISGRIARSTSPKLAPNISDMSGAERLLSDIRWYSHMLSFLAALIVGVILVRFYPNFLVTVSENLGKNFIKNTLIGFASFILIPVFLLILAITIVGLPLSFLLFLTYIASLYLSKIFLAFWLGRKLYKSAKSVYATLLVGLLAFYIMRIIPIFGFFVGILALFVGLGVVLTSYPEIHRKALRDKVI